MFLLVQNLLDRLRQPPGRALELATVRCRLARETRSCRRARPEERIAAARLGRLREQIGHAQGRLAACASCTRGHPPPEGTWEGGHCCSGSTDDVFRDYEVAALSLSGTRARHLRARRARSAGCAFRGPSGCALPPRHRPNVCSRYLCTESRRELFRRGDLQRIQRLIDELEDVLDQFLRARDARLDEEEIQALRIGGR